MATKLSRTACPIEATLSLISDKWKILILRDLLTGTKRFGELKKSIGSISQKVLTSNLRAMEDDGLVVRQVYAEVPPRVEYTLTERGESLRPVIDAMRTWGEEHQAELVAEEEAAKAKERGCLQAHCPAEGRARSGEKSRSGEIAPIETFENDPEAECSGSFAVLLWSASSAILRIREVHRWALCFACLFVAHSPCGSFRARNKGESHGKSCR